MNCKLILLFAVLLCIGQGHAAPWWGKIEEWGQGIKNKAEEFGSDIANKVSGSTNDIQETFKNAGSSLKDKIDTARQNVEDSIKSSAENARAEIEDAASNLGGKISSLTDNAMMKMDPQSIIDEATKVSEKIDVVVADVKSQIKNAVETAKNGTTKRIGSWDEVVQQAVAKAKELGVDVGECSVDSVKALATEALQNAVGCITNKYQEAKGLVTRFIEIGKEGHQLVEDLRAARDECSQKSRIDAVVCGGKQMIPAFKRIVALGASTVETSTKAVTLVQTLQVSLTTCVSGVAAVEATKVPALTIDITKCIAQKVQQNREAAAAA